jgi:ribonuclease BN (tRNA processing enzyme)
MPFAVTRRRCLTTAAACATASIPVLLASYPSARVGEGREGSGDRKVALLGTKGGRGRANPSNLVSHAYAYRFDASGRSIVFSGDTTYSPELIALAKGADVLVREVMHLGGLDRLLSRDPNWPSLSHTTEQCGDVAAEARVKKLVLSHLVPGDDPAITDAMWIEGVRKNFSGEIVVGRDLMMI